MKKTATGPVPCRGCGHQHRPACAAGSCTCSYVDVVRGELGLCACGRCSCGGFRARVMRLITGQKQTA